jgi:parvulin-like peptidyl-prolyl isomerase
MFMHTSFTFLCTGTTHAFSSTASPLSAAAAVTQAPASQKVAADGSSAGSSSSSGGQQQQQQQQGAPAAPKLSFDQLHEQYQAQLTLRNIQGGLLLL